MKDTIKYYIIRLRRDIETDTQIHNAFEEDGNEEMKAFMLGKINAKQKIIEDLQNFVDNY